MVSEPFPRRGAIPDFLVLAGIMLLALAIRLVPVIRGGGLFGVFGYDDGVYFGSAVALINGRIPYRDFLLLHPPGILYVLAPFASLAATIGDGGSLAVARVSFMVLGSVNAGLVTVVAGRLGRRAALSAGALYAVWQFPALIERTTWLIAPQSTLLLLALLVLARPERVDAPPRLGIVRAASAGALLGMAFGLQLWGVVPLTVVLGWIVFATRRQPGGWLRPSIAYVAAAGVAVAIVWLPMLVLAGGDMLHFVLSVQLGRSTNGGSIVSRLGQLDVLLRHRAWSRVLLGVAVWFLLVVVAWAAWRRPAIRLWAVLLASQLAVLLWVPPYVHYIAWAAPAAALAIGGAVDTVLIHLGGRRSTVVGLVYAVGLVVLLATNVMRPAGRRIDTVGLQHAVANARCVTADSAVLLVEAEALRRVVENGCPLKLDPTGMSYESSGAGRPRRDQPAYQQAMIEYYTGGDAAVFTRAKLGQFRPETWRAIMASLPQVHRIGGLIVLKRADQ